MGKPIQVSEEFRQAVITSSTSDVECGFCGRMHFYGCEDGEFDWDEGELETLLAKSKKSPDRFICHEYPVEWGFLDGKKYVPDCPCNSGSKYEQLFLNERFLIGRFLLARAEKIRRESAQESALAGSILEIK
ncbi:MAG: hypothetical protein WC533_00275 [Candidatus Pacearchaeota archaeon]